MRKIYNPLRILSSNGWQWIHYTDELMSENDDMSQYKADFLGNCYSSTIVALVSEHSGQLDLNGHYGVQWLEAKYENSRNGCYSYCDLSDMQSAIELAEENLLRIGMPFAPDYDFHGKYVSRKQQQNEKLRKMYNLDELEKEDDGNDWPE